VEPANLDRAHRKARRSIFRAEVKTEASDLRFKDKDVGIAKADRSKSGRVLFAQAEQESALYDRDGNCEIVFANSNCNRDGHVLFDDDFRSAAEFGGSYH
jgi:hypothetical protein